MLFKAYLSFYLFAFCNPSLATSENLAFSDKLHFVSYTTLYMFKNIASCSSSHFQI